MLTAFDIQTTRRYKKLFENYTQRRKELAYNLYPESALVAFEIIPALLSVNVAGLPGYVEGGDAVCGICRTGSPRELKKVLQEYFPEIVNGRNGFQKFLIQRPVIESLLLIGSIGTVAQTKNSDFDYWVCFDNRLVSPKWVQILCQKAALIEQWCHKRLNMEVHFFVSDIDHIQVNDFGQVDEESTGSSQRKFLKEECYRTILLVAGKIPFWWVTEPGLNEPEYRLHWEQLAELAPYDMVDYIDLGPLAHIDREEFLGAALWQLSKGLKDPFKAIIKMSLLEWYLSSDFDDFLLCNEVKKRVFDKSSDLMDVDPYLTMIKVVLNYYGENEKAVNMELLQRALYLKSATHFTRMRIKLARQDYKIKVFKTLMTEWNWSLEKFEYLNQIKDWGYARRLEFAKRINDFFFSTYAKLKATRFDETKQAIAEDDLRRLKQKLYVHFSRQPNKLQMTPFLAARNSILKRCIFKFGRDKAQQHHWFLFDATRYSFEPKSQPARIYDADRLARIAAWVILNGLYDHHKTTIEMPPNPTGINVNDLIELLRHMYGFFKSAMDQIKMDERFHQQPRPEHIMVVADIEHDTTCELSQYTLDFLYRNTWGEMYFETHDFYSGLSALMKHIGSMNLQLGQVPTNRIKIHLPKHKQNWEGAGLIRDTIFKGLKN